MCVRAYVWSDSEVIQIPSIELASRLSLIWVRPARNSTLSDSAAERWKLERGLKQVFDSICQSDGPDELEICSNPKLH